MSKKSDKPRAPREDEAQPPIEVLMAELDSIVSELESGRLGLTEALNRYEAGVARIRQCYELLDQAERRVSIIMGTNPDGTPVAQPFDEQVGTLADRAEQRSQRRSHPGASRDRELPLLGDSP